MKALWKNREINQVEERWRRMWVWLCACYRHQGQRVGKGYFYWVSYRAQEQERCVWTSQIIYTGVLGNWCVLSLSHFYKCALVSSLVFWSRLVALCFWVPVPALGFWQRTFLPQMCALGSFGAKIDSKICEINKSCLPVRRGSFRR